MFRSSFCTEACGKALRSQDDAWLFYGKHRKAVAQRSGVPDPSAVPRNSMHTSWDL